MEPDPINILEDQLAILEKYKLIDKASGDKALAEYVPVKKSSMLGGAVLTPEQLEAAKAKIQRLQDQLQRAEAGGQARIPAIITGLKKSIAVAQRSLETDERDTAEASAANAVQLREGAPAVDLPMIQEQLQQQVDAAEEADAEQPPAPGMPGAVGIAGMAAAAVNAVVQGQDPLQPVMAVVHRMDSTTQQNVIQAFGVNQAGAQMIAQQLQGDLAGAVAAVGQQLQQNAETNMAQIQAGHQFQMIPFQLQLQHQQGQLQLAQQHQQNQFQLAQQAMNMQGAFMQMQFELIKGRQTIEQQSIAAQERVAKAAIAAPHKMTEASIRFGGVIAAIISLVGTGISYGAYHGAESLLAMLNSIINGLARPLLPGMPLIPGASLWGVGYLVSAVNGIITFVLSLAIVGKQIFLVILRSLAGLVGLGGVAAAGVIMIICTMLALAAWKIATSQELSLPVGFWGQIKLGNTPVQPASVVPTISQPTAPSSAQALQMPQFQLLPDQPAAQLPAPSVVPLLTNIVPTTVPAPAPAPAPALLGDITRAPAPAPAPALLGDITRAPAPPPAVTPNSNMTIPQLKALAAQRGVTIPGNVKTKAAIIALLAAPAAPPAFGPPVAGPPPEAPIGDPLNGVQGGSLFSRAHPLSLPTRRGQRSSSSSKRRYTHRQRASRTGKGGYRPTKSGRKA